MSAEPERLIESSESPLEEETALRAGREWIEGLRAKSEREGVLNGDPEDELLSDQYQVGNDIGDDKEMELIPGFAFWRIRENLADGLLSTPYLTLKRMIVESIRFRKDNKDETWVHLRSPVDEDSTFEKAHIRLSRLEAGEHSISISDIEPDSN